MNLDAAPAGELSQEEKRYENDATLKIRDRLIEERGISFFAVDHCFVVFYWRNPAKIV